MSTPASPLPSRVSRGHVLSSEAPPPFAQLK